MTMTFSKPALIEFNSIPLSDHNRGPLGIEPELIENSQRMANGTMRKQIIAKKYKFSVDWTDLPHFAGHTVDGFWGGGELKYFFDNQVGSFDLIVRWGDGTVQEYQVFITSFSYNIKKRGVYDFWDVSISLEEA